VLLTHQALKYSPEAVVPQRVFFLHDELTHLPSFPRRSVESCFGMYMGAGGEELQSMDSLHKLVWARLMSDIFEKMENAFMFGDLHLFINVINGIMIIHCEDVLILRWVCPSGGNCLNWEGVCSITQWEWWSGSGGARELDRLYWSILE